MRVLRFLGLVLLSCASASTPSFDGPDATPAVEGGPDTSIVDASRADAADSRAPSCTDGVRNGDESDVDCGGGTCPACGDGLGCGVTTDCKAGSCVAAKCGPHAWTVASTGSNVPIPPDNTWVDGAGLVLNPNLYTPSLVYLRWTGTLRFGGGGNGLCHVGQRFLIDGQPTGDPSWGNAIMVLRGASRWHESFNVEIATVLSPGAHKISVQMTNGVGMGLCYLDGDGGTPYDHSRLAASAHDTQHAWYAESTAETGAQPGPSPWVDIPGVSVPISITSPSHVQMSLSGSQLAQSASVSHCAYRLVVDKMPLGDPSHGQAISVGDNFGGWWGPVAIRMGQDMTVGAHTISAQMSNSSNAGGTCNAGAGNAQYARFRLFANAGPQMGPAVSVESAGGSYVLGSNSAWTAIGGMSAMFNLPISNHVQFEMAATERTMSGSGHCAWRYVIDGMPIGDATHGLAINVGDGALTWWTATPLLWGQDLAAGSHTVSVEVRNSSLSGDCGTNADAAAYGRARLLVRAL